MGHLDKFVAGLFLVCSMHICPSISSNDDNFDEYYYITWNKDHVIRNRGSIVQLYMTQVRGGAAFMSKNSYGSGFFKMRIKLPGKESAGVVTAYYLTSGDHNTHDELDFEFLGNRAGKRYTVQTNIFIHGKGDREQRLTLWFDPTAHFHTYSILWNEFHIVFLVDDVPIREFKNNKRFGVSYPTQAMKVAASLWNGENWATDGGQTKINWTCEPFRAYFDEFNIDGCPANGINIGPCNAGNYWWNQKMYRKLNPTQQKAYQNVKNKYLNYDYCTDKPRYPVPPPECNHL
ncbi:xyloglucan endotransglucosylase/hydrolase protein 2-like [Silene latifolia]|uniref:xyloglucan endotransglucosylase/hydrolase protein 2-like n=1 Tax=Silene latifolia TaxID=37657 RepID=UPI003D775331